MLRRAIAVHQMAGRFGADAFARRALGVAAVCRMVQHGGELLAGNELRRCSKDDLRRGTSVQALQFRAGRKESGERAGRDEG